MRSRISLDLEDNSVSVLYPVSFQYPFSIPVQYSFSIHLSMQYPFGIRSVFVQYPFRRFSIRSLLVQYPFRIRSVSDYPFSICPFTSIRSLSLYPGSIRSEFVQYPFKIRSVSVQNSYSIHLVSIHSPSNIQYPYHYCRLWIALWWIDDTNYLNQELFQGANCSFVCLHVAGRWRRW